jgi:F-type H+-transporting ATPase subunit epsilon
MADQSSKRLLHCVIVTPEKTVLDLKAASVTLPLDDGSRGIAVGHAPFIGRLGTGEVRMSGVAGRASSQTSLRTFVEGGFAEVGQDTVTIITQRAVDATTIDAAEAQSELTRITAERATGDEAIAARMAAETAARQRLRTARR